MNESTEAPNRAPAAVDERSQVKAHIEDSSTMQSSESLSEDNQLINSIAIWTTIGASIATMIATAIAYRESKKNR